MGESSNASWVLFAFQTVRFTCPGAFRSEGDVQSRAKAGRTDCVSYTRGWMPARRERFPGNGGICGNLKDF